MRLFNLNNLLQKNYDNFYIFMVKHYLCTSASLVESLPFRKIPGPKSIHRAILPGGECYKKDASTILNYLRRCYGDIYKIYQVSSGDYLVVTYDPNDFEKIYREEGAWPERKIFPTVDYFRLEYAPNTAGLLNFQGKKWHEIRTILNPIMMQPNAVNTYIPKIDELTQELIKIVSKIRDENGETSPEFEKYINRWVVDSAGYMAFDMEIGALRKTHGSNADELIETVEKATHLIYQLDLLPSIWRFYKTKKFYKCMTTQKRVAEIAEEYLEEAKQKIKNSNKIKTEKEKSILEKVLEVNEALALPVAIDILGAGIETVTSSLKSVLYLLAKNKSKQEKLRNEIISAMPTKNSPITASMIKHTPYLRSLIKETLRIYPPAPGNTRILKSDIVLQGYKIPKGTNIAFPNAALSRSEAHFHRANQFIPERWMRDMSNEDEGCKHAKETHPFVYSPFGFGSRSCVGKRFAELEMMIFIIRFVREFEFEWHHPDMEVQSTIVDILVGDMKFKLIESKI
uniref:CSON005232 protein n=1 Tax=Culicoides sonorensis TaxID=179676 RepID=A0A336M4C2_CULSO